MIHPQLNDFLFVLSHFLLNIKQNICRILGFLCYSIEIIGLFLFLEWWQFLHSKNKTFKNYWIFVELFSFVYLFSSVLLKFCKKWITKLGSHNKTLVQLFFQDLASLEIEVEWNVLYISICFWNEWTIRWFWPVSAPKVISWLL